jgi:glycosyltransferase involved in cell wall biosynthesis
MDQGKIKVLFLSSWYPTLQQPTLGNFVEKHAEAAAWYADVSVIHVCFTDDTADIGKLQHYQKNKVEVYIKYLKKRSSSIPYISSISKMFQWRKHYKKIFKEVYGEKKPDVIHANVTIPVSLIARQFSRSKKISYIISEHWTGFLPQDPNKPGKHWSWYRKAANKAAFIAPVTMNLGKAMKTFGITTPMKVVPNVVDTDLFVPLPKHVEKFHLLHISSLNENQKNFNGIIEAISLLKKTRGDFVLDVISDGNIDSYNQKIKECNLAENIVFHGKKNAPEIAEILGKSHLLLLFSRYENFPCVIAEAFSCGVPVISTNVGGIAEYLSNANGTFIQDENIEELCQSIDFILNNLKNYDAQKIRKVALKNFSYEVIGQQFLDLYQQTIAEKHV